MTQGERVKKVRKFLGLTLDKFGEKLGVTKQTISRIENNINNVTEQMAKSICREFNVDYFWLTEGIGDEMFIEKTTDPIKLIAKEYELTDLEAQLVEIMIKFIKLTPSEREEMIKAIRELF